MAPSVAARPTPEIEALAAETCAGLDGDEAKARALLAKVTSIVKQPNPRSAASAVATLLQEEGNPVHLYSALLTAARIEHDLVWSTDVSPECDPDQGLPFPDLARFGKRSQHKHGERDPGKGSAPGSSMPHGSPLAQA